MARIISRTIRLVGYPRHDYQSQLRRVYRHLWQWVQNNEEQQISNPEEISDDSNRSVCPGVHETTGTEYDN